MNKQNGYIVFTNELAYYLRKLGFRILEVEPNFKKPQYDVYKFEDSEKLRQAIMAYKQQKAGGSYNENNTKPKYNKDPKAKVLE